MVRCFMCGSFKPRGGETSAGSERCMGWCGGASVERRVDGPCCVVGGRACRVSQVQAKTIRCRYVRRFVWFDAVRAEAVPSDSTDALPAASMERTCRECAKRELSTMSARGATGVMGSGWPSATPRTGRTSLRSGEDVRSTLSDAATRSARRDRNRGGERHMAAARRRRPAGRFGPRSGGRPAGSCDRFLRWRRACPAQGGGTERGGRRVRRVNAARRSPRIRMTSRSDVTTPPFSPALFRLCLGIRRGGRVVRAGARTTAVRRPRTVTLEGSVSGEAPAGGRILGRAGDKAIALSASVGRGLTPACRRQSHRPRCQFGARSRGLRRP